MLAREILTCSGRFWLSVSMGLFAAGARLFFSTWQWTASSRGSRGLHGLRYFVSIGAFLAGRMAASSRVLTWLFLSINSPVMWRWASSRVLLGLHRRRSSILPEEFGLDVVFAPFALFSIAKVTFVIAVVDPAVTKVVLFVSGGRGLQARPLFLANSLLLASRGGGLRACLFFVVTMRRRTRSVCLAGERGGVSALAVIELACGVATWAPMGSDGL